MFFYEKIHMDEKGRKIVNHEVYKEIMVFFKLLEKDIFGGRVMVTRNQLEDSGQRDYSGHYEPS